MKPRGGEEGGGKGRKRGEREGERIVESWRMATYTRCFACRGF